MQDKRSTTRSDNTDKTWQQEERDTQLLEEERDRQRDQHPRPADNIHTTNYADREPPTRQLYAIIDSVTNSIIGGIQLHMNHASAIRTLYDIAIADTMLNKHPLDFDLWLLGALGNDHRLNGNLTRLVSGAQIEAIVKASKKLDHGDPK